MPGSKPASPRIIDFRWGRIELDNGDSFRDAKLYPGGAREWDWNETGTRHVPGIQPDDIEELLERGAEVLVLGQGVYQRLQVCPETLRYLEGRDIEVHILQTEDAVEAYNALVATRPVGGLFHSTC